MGSTVRQFPRPIRSSRPNDEVVEEFSAVIERLALIFLSITLGFLSFAIFSGAPWPIIFFAAYCSVALGFGAMNVVFAGSALEAHGLTKALVKLRKIQKDSFIRDAANLSFAATKYLMYATARGLQQLQLTLLWPSLVLFKINSMGFSSPELTNVSITNWLKAIQKHGAVAHQANPLVLYVSTTAVIGIALVFFAVTIEVIDEAAGRAWVTLIAIAVLMGHIVFVISDGLPAELRRIFRYRPVSFTFFAVIFISDLMVLLTALLVYDRTGQELRQVQLRDYWISLIGIYKSDMWFDFMSPGSFQWRDMYVATIKAIFPVAFVANIFRWGRFKFTQADSVLLAARLNLAGAPQKALKILSEQSTPFSDALLIARAVALLGVDKYDQALDDCQEVLKRKGFRHIQYWLLAELFRCAQNTHAPYEKQLSLLKWILAQEGIRDRHLFFALSSASIEFHTRVAEWESLVQSRKDVLPISAATVAGVNKNFQEALQIIENRGNWPIDEIDEWLIAICIQLALGLNLHGNNYGRAEAILTTLEMHLLKLPDEEARMYFGVLVAHIALQVDAGRSLQYRQRLTKLAWQLRPGEHASIRSRYIGYPQIHVN